MCFYARYFAQINQMSIKFFDWVILIHDGMTQEIERNLQRRSRASTSRSEPRATNSVSALSEVGAWFLVRSLPPAPPLFVYVSERSRRWPHRPPSRICVWLACRCNNDNHDGIPPTDATAKCWPSRALVVETKRAETRIKPLDQSHGDRSSEYTRRRDFLRKTRHPCLQKVRMQKSRWRFTNKV